MPDGNYKNVLTNIEEDQFLTRWRPVLTAINHSDRYKPDGSVQCNKYKDIYPLFKKQQLFLFFIFFQRELW